MLSQTCPRLAVCAAVALACLFASAGGAGAQSDGVHVDPESPAGKEYALPLESARRDAAGGAPSSGGATSSGGSDPAPLFGEGISRDRSRGSGNGSDNRSRGGDDKSPRNGLVDSSVATAVAENGSGLSAGLLTVLIALGVLLVGGVVGLSFRALRTTDAPR